MSREMRASIPLTDAQLEQLRNTTDGGKRNFPQGYRLIHSWIQDNPAAQQDGTAFWFEQAAGINQSTSLSASFIRRHTENGLDLANVPMEKRLPMQELSDRIARKVIEDVIDKRQVEPLPLIISKDIRVALDDGGVKLGGWGGSFYYWDQPFSNNPKNGFPRNPDGTYKTIGQEITRLGQRDLLIDTSALTLKQMVIAGEIGVRDVPDMVATNWNAGMPLGMKAEVASKATVMVYDHIVERTGEELEAFPGELRQLLERQRDHLLDGAKDKLQDLLTPDSPGIPRLGPGLSGNFTPEDENRLQQLTARLDGVLARDRELAQTFPTMAPSMSMRSAPASHMEVATPAMPSPPQATAPAPIPAHLQDFRHEGHPLHARYSEALTAVHAMEDRQRIPHGPHSEQLAAALAVETHQARTYTVKQVDLQGPLAMATVTVPSKDSYMHEEHTLRLDTRQALSRSVEQTSADWSRQNMPHLHEPVPAMSPAPPLDLARLPAHDPRHPGHAGHAQYQVLREQVGAVYARHGIPRSEQQIEQATAAVALAARHGGLERADRLWLTPDPRTGQLGPNSGIGVVQDHRDPLFSTRSQAKQDDLQRAPEDNWQARAQVAQEQMEVQARQARERQEEMARGPRGPVMG